MTDKNAIAFVATLLALATGALNAAPAMSDIIAAAIADAARPAEQIRRDAMRKPAQVIAFSGLKPGDRIADFMSGGAYYTRLFSNVVGPRGHVYALLPEEELKNCPAEETAGTRAVQHDPHYANVSVIVAPVNTLHAPAALDVIFTSLNFHDLFDPFMGPANVPVVVKAFFDTLKPGGTLVIIDHVAQPGSEIRDTDTLHRIDPEVIIRTVEAAGFRLDAQSDALRNPDDDHARRVFDPAIRGHTDQVMLRFRKPASAD